MKKPMPKSTQWSASRPGGTLLSACAGLSLLSGALHAGPLPKNLGSGLDALVEANQTLAAAKKNGTAAALPMYNGFATEKAGNVSSLAITDSTSRVLVRLFPDGTVPLATLQTLAAAAAPSLKIQATDPEYHGVGVFEAWVALDDVPKLAGLQGVKSVKLTPKPVHAQARRPLAASTTTFAGAVAGETLKEIGTTFDFGITQHRVDQINKTYNPSATVDYEGTGITIGDLSDSYNTNTGAVATASQDVGTGDLPGPGNAINTQPVVVLQDYPYPATDEGRGMLQTIYKMAPKARLGFATADLGEVDFANEIRALAALPGHTYSTAVQQGFKADVIVDDVSYLDEPFFQDGIVAQGVNDVVTAGVSYFSSAANNPGTNGYDSDFRFVANGTGLTAAAGNTALAGTNINLANVPANLYAGGFHNFNPSGMDVAQTVNIPNAATLAEYGLTGIPVILQWNDPDDTTTPAHSSTPSFTDSGTITYNPTTEMGNAATFMHPLTKGQEYYLDLVPAATPTTKGDNPLDGQITVIDPSGNQILFVDNNGSGQPETATFFAPVVGTYTFKVTAYETPNSTPPDITDGSFTLYTYTASGTDLVTQDLNLLVFDLNGNYLPADSATSNNIASGSPIEITEFASPAATSNPPPASYKQQVQFVISRSNQQPASGRAANHLRYLCFGDGLTALGPAEYFSYTTPVTFGHSCAAGANGVAAYPFYRPSIPEYYTSPGPSTIYFNADNSVLSTPQVRQKPDVAAMDGANTTFFGGDADQDEDRKPNFFGTSDAAPHAAAIAALVLQANGGSGKVTPAQMKSVLQRAAFTHDLDPYFSTGTAATSDGKGTVTVTFVGDDEFDANGTEGIRDVNSIAVQFTGTGSVASFVLNPSGSTTTSGNPTDGTNGLTVPRNGASTYFETSTPGMVFSKSNFPFTLGTSSPSLTSSTVTGTYSNPDTTPANVNSIRYFTLTLTFSPGAFASGDILHFTAGRDEYESANTAEPEPAANGSADVIGGGVLLPDGTVHTSGMPFRGTTSTGATFSGTIQNTLGSGYSVLDGYGFINAQSAVSLPLTTQQ